jgi:hypothetical protein
LKCFLSKGKEKEKEKEKEIKRKERRIQFPGDQGR